MERVAGGFDFTEGPVWSPEGALLFSSPNTNAIYRLDPDIGKVTVFRSKSGYTGVDIGRFAQPGSNGLTFSPDGLLTMCQHGNRRLVRVNPHGDITVLADSYEGKRLNSPNDLVYRSDGTLYFTDPPFGLPEVFDDPDKELPFSGVFRARDGDVQLVTDELEGPNGLGFSPDERYLYVGNWDPDSKVVMRYEIDEAGDPIGAGEVLYDMTDAPGRGRDRRSQGRPGRQPLRLRPRRRLDPLLRGGAAGSDRAPREPAQPRLGRRRPPLALCHRPDQHLPDAPGNPGRAARVIPTR